MFKDPEKGKKYRARWYQLNKEAANKHGNKWRRNHNKQHAATTKARRLAIKQEVLTHYGNGKCECVLCGFSNIIALSLDHIDGGGCRHRREIRNSNGVVQGKNYGGTGGWMLYQILKRSGYPQGYRTLCLNCQFVEHERLKGLAMQEREKCTQCGKDCEFTVKTADGVFCSTKCANASHSSIVTASINEVSNEPITLGSESGKSV